MSIIYEYRCLGKKIFIFRNKVLLDAKHERHQK